MHRFQRHVQNFGQQLVDVVNRVDRLADCRKRQQGIFAWMLLDHGKVKHSFELWEASALPIHCATGHGLRAAANYAVSDELWPRLPRAAEKFDGNSFAFRHDA